MTTVLASSTSAEPSFAFFCFRNIVSETNVRTFLCKFCAFFYSVINNCITLQQLQLLLINKWKFIYHSKMKLGLSDNTKIECSGDTVLVICRSQRTAVKALYIFSTPRKLCWFQVKGAFKIFPLLLCMFVMSSSGWKQSNRETLWLCTYWRWKFVSNRYIINLYPVLFPYYDEIRVTN